MRDKKDRKYRYCDCNNRGMNRRVFKNCRYKE